MNRLLLLLAAVLAAPANAVTPPAPFIAEYTVVANGFTVGEMERRLRPTGEEGYILETRMRTTGLAALFKDERLHEQSVWRIHDQRLLPQEYVFEQDGRRNKSERVVFDWDENQAVISHNDSEKTVPIAPGTYDKLSYQVALRQELKRGHRTMRYAVVDRRGVHEYAFRVAGEELLETPMGTFRTVKVERVDGSKGRNTTFWCAIEYDYLLVQIVQEDRGDVFASYLAAIRQFQPDPPADTLSFGGR